MAEKKFSTEQLYDKTKSLYKLVNLAARRAIEINRGAAPLVETDKNTNVAYIALDEIIQDKVTFKKTEGIKAKDILEKE